MSLNSIPEIIAELKAGRMAVLVDDEDRENEGDLIFVAEFVTAEKINFMAKFGRGLICMPITESHGERLNLLPMVARNRSVHGTNFTVSIEAASGVTTGISAADRAHTIKVAASPKATPADIVQPGHVFPLIAQAGGVLVRAGHTEACCDLACLAGLTPAAVLCEIMREDGAMARLPDLVHFAAEHGLKIGTIAELIEYRSRNESLVARTLERDVETAWGRFHLVAYRDLALGSIHLALVLGTPAKDRETLVRVHEPLSIVDLLDAGPGTHSWGVGEALAAIREAGEDAMVALGTVIRGETYHFEVVANESARGVMEVALESGLPIANGILTTEDEAQAEARLEKGAEAVRVALEMAKLRESFHEER